MSAKPSTEEQPAPHEASAEAQKSEAAAAEDNRPQAGSNEQGPATAEAGSERPAKQEAAAAEAEAGQSAGAEARVAELEAQVADLTDRLLRAHAEIDNIRKRAERERLDTAKYAITKFAGDIVVLADNFQRAIAVVPERAIEQDTTLKGLVEGVQMMEREFLNVLERHGIKRIDPQGQPFNPHLHDAVMEQQNADVPNGTVVQVFQPGYTIEDRVLRPAMVVVSRGGPKAAPAEKPAEQKADSAAQEPAQAHSTAESGSGASSENAAPDDDQSQ